MRIRILGSAAGGGLPQWNCRCANCEAVRAGAPNIAPRSQSSVALSADGHAWFLLNVSPDVTRQILAFPELGPEKRDSYALRSTAIAGCVLTDAEFDHTAGLIFLREQKDLRIFCTTTVRHWLARDFPLERMLAGFHDPAWINLPLDVPNYLPLHDGSASALQVRAVEVDRHVPKYVWGDPVPAAGAVVALYIEDMNTGGRLLYAPCLPAVTPLLAGLAADAACVLIDGTFWSDAELLRLGIGDRTARAMGHLPVGGSDGSLNWLGALTARHRAYVHINNTNPMLNQTGSEHRMVVDHGIRVAADGDEFDV